MGRQLCIYVDVDDTLVRSVGEKRIPIPAVVRHVRDLYEQGAELYCWSSGGADYARQSAEELHLQECFLGFLSKPQIMIDDQLVSDWPGFAHVYPSSCHSLDHYRAILKRD